MPALYSFPNVPSYGSTTVQDIQLFTQLILVIICIARGI